MLLDSNVVNANNTEASYLFRISKSHVTSWRTHIIKEAIYRMKVPADDLPGHKIILRLFVCWLDNLSNLWGNPWCQSLQRDTSE